MAQLILVRHGQSLWNALNKFTGWVDVPLRAEATIASCRLSGYRVNVCNVLIAAHGNSLRSIMMILNRLSPDEVTSLDLATGVPIVYELDAAGGSIGKKILND